MRKYPDTRHSDCAGYRVGTLRAVAVPHPDDEQAGSTDIGRPIDRSHAEADPRTQAAEVLHPAG